MKDYSKMTFMEILVLPTEELRQLIKTTYSKCSWYDLKGTEDRATLQRTFVRYNDLVGEARKKAAEARSCSTQRTYEISTDMKHPSYFGSTFNSARECCPYCGRFGVVNEDDDFEGDSIRKRCPGCRSTYSIQEFLSHWNESLGEDSVYYEGDTFDYDDGTAYPYM